MPEGGKDAEELWLTREQRLSHTAVFGATGVGKSTFLLNLIEQDMARGDGLLLLDPHGQLAEAALSLVPRSRTNEVCYLDAGDLEHAVGLNILEDRHLDERAVIVDAVVSAMRSIWHESWGPRMEQILRHACTALVEIPNASLVLLPRLLTDDKYRTSIIGRISSPQTRAFFGDRFDEWRDEFRETAIDPVLNKVEAFFAFPHIQNILGQGSSTLHFEQAMERGRIVIANLAKGKIGESASRLLGALLIARVQTAAMSRRWRDGEELKPFHLLVDEAHSFNTQALALLLSESRKFGVSIVVVSQYLASLSDTMRAALLGNASTTVAFRVGAEDASILAPAFNEMIDNRSEQKKLNPAALLELRRGEALVRIAGDGARVVDLPPPPLGTGNAEAVKKQSIRHYTRPREVVERNINKARGYQQ